MYPKWVTRFFFITLLVIFISFRYFIYLDVPNKCFIRIYPSLIELSNKTIIDAIKILKNTSEEEYQKLCQYVSIIDPNPSCGGFEGGCFYTRRPKTIDVGTSYRSAAWAAAVIAHETCHAIQYASSRPLDEPECYQIGLKVTKQVFEF